MKMEKFKNCLVWLRNDLRFHDNEVENASVTGIFLKLIGCEIP